MVVSVVWEAADEAPCRVAPAEVMLVLGIVTRMCYISLRCLHCLGASPRLGVKPMPRYSFVCDACSEQVELPTRTPSPHTCGGHLRRIWHAPAISFKGAGFTKSNG